MQILVGMVKEVVPHFLLPSLFSPRHYQQIIMGCQNIPEKTFRSCSKMKRMMVRSVRTRNKEDGEMVPLFRYLPPFLPPFNRLLHQKKKKAKTAAMKRMIMSVMNQNKQDGVLFHLLLCPPPLFPQFKRVLHQKKTQQPHQHSHPFFLMMMMRRRMMTVLLLPEEKDVFHNRMTVLEIWHPSVPHVGHPLKEEVDYEIYIILPHKYQNARRRQSIDLEVVVPPHQQQNYPQLLETIGEKNNPNVVFLIRNGIIPKQQQQQRRHVVAVAAP
mmetsp:Transcript_11327/g.13047  ORF Transcript_11327/g.13047 Transcript_11327/m.13047 type:complete len:270 (+) Transcript_11327:471-1280(+)